MFRLDVGRWRFGFFLSWLNAISNYPEEIRNMNTSTDSPFLRGTRKSQLLLFAHIPFILHLCNCWQHTTEFSKWRNVFNFSNGQWTYYKKKAIPRSVYRIGHNKNGRLGLLFRFTSDVLVLAICCVLRWDDDEPQTEWKIFCAFDWHLWCLGYGYGCVLLRNVAEYSWCPMRNEWINGGLSVYFDA